MDKQMIKEMAKEINRILFEDCLLNMGGHCEDCECNREEKKEYDCQSYLVAKKLLEKYQPKIPEGAVVLTKEEHKSLIYWEGRFDELIKLATEATRKETAEKFAERLNAKLTDIIPFEDYEVADWNYDGMDIENSIDEICKEIIGGKDDDTSQVGK